MLADTNKVHEHIVAIGQSLGFDAKREVALAAADGYQPRLDILWSLPLTTEHLAAIGAVGAHVPLVGSALPLGAWEVEGSDASTKGMQADLANLRVSGALLSFLAVRGGTIDNLYERAVNLERTQAHYFGKRHAFVLDSAWIEELAGIRLSRVAAKLAEKEKEGSGGTGAWAKGVTQDLRRRGTAAGFNVLSEYQRPSNPAAPTQSKIDLVWALPLPEGLATFAEEISRRAGESAPSLGRRYAAVPVVAFEIENDASKHGHGGLLNLASHAMCGVFVAGTEQAAGKAEKARDTYRAAFPLANVTISRGFMQ